MTRIAGTALLAVLFWCCSIPWAFAQNAECKDIYQVYQTCFDGGSQMDKEGCGYFVEALGPRLMGEEGLTGFSAALTVAMCKRGCEDGARGKPAMSLSSFRKEFCGGGLK